MLVFLVFTASVRLRPPNKSKSPEHFFSFSFSLQAFLFTHFEVSQEAFWYATLLEAKYRETFFKLRPGASITHSDLGPRFLTVADFNEACKLNLPGFLSVADVKEACKLNLPGFLSVADFIKACK